MPSSRLWNFEMRASCHGAPGFRIVSELRPGASTVKLQSARGECQEARRQIAARTIEFSGGSEHAHVLAVFAEQTLFAEVVVVCVQHKGRIDFAREQGLSCDFLAANVIAVQADADVVLDCCVRVLGQTLLIVGKRRSQQVRSRQQNSTRTDLHFEEVAGN